MLLTSFWLTSSTQSLVGVFFCLWICSVHDKLPTILKSQTQSLWKLILFLTISFSFAKSFLRLKKNGSYQIFLQLTLQCMRNKYKKIDGSLSFCLFKDINPWENSLLNVHENSLVIKSYDVETSDKHFEYTLTISYWCDMEKSNISQ